MAKNQLVTFMMPVDMYREIQRQTKKQNKTQSAIIRESIAYWLDKRCGVIVDPSVQIGGYRETDESQDKNSPEAVAIG